MNEFVFVGKHSCNLLKKNEKRTIARPTALTSFPKTERNR